MDQPVSFLFVPGLRDHHETHWQTLLAARLPRSRLVPPMGKKNISCADRVAAMEREAQAIQGPLVIIAHSAGVIATVHWAQQTRRAVTGALLATPPDLEKQLPSEYPSLESMRAGGWLPVPAGPLPFKSIVAASRNDPLAGFARVTELARGWGSQLTDIGEVGHLNPVSGYGEWNGADALLAELIGEHQYSACLKEGV